MNLKLSLFSILGCLAVFGVSAQSPRGYQGVRLPKGSVTNAIRFSEKSKKFTYDPKPFKNPKITTTGGDLYGYCVYSLNDANRGWFEIPVSMPPVHLWIDTPSMNYFNMKAGWLNAGKLCGISSYEVFGIVIAYNYVELDPLTGELLLQREIDIQSSNLSSYFTAATYCPEDNRVYGFGLNTDGRAHVFKSANADLTEFSIIKIIDDNQQCASITWNAAEGKLVGVNNEGALVEIDRKSGAQNTLMQTSVPEWRPYITGLVYSPIDDAYIWNVNTYDNGVEGSYLYFLNPEENRSELFTTFHDAEEFTFLITHDEPILNTAPARPAFLTSNFKGADLFGSLTFRLPEKLRNGENIETQIDWTASVDGVTVKNGSGGPGSEVTVDFEELKPGMRVFTLTPALNGNPGLPASWYGWIGNDNPSIPQNVVLKDNTVSWNAVTTGAHNGYIKTEDIIYKIYLNDELQGTTSGLNYTIEYPENTSVTNYQATVIAECGGMASDPGYSNSVIYGDAFTLPLLIYPTDEQVGLVEFEDADADGMGWSVMEYDESTVFMSAITMDGNANDWIFMPKFTTLDKSKVFAVTLDAALVDEGFPDGRLKIALGTAPSSESMTKVIASDIALTSMSFNTLTYLFTIPEEMQTSDIFYLGINATTPANVIYAAFVKNIEIAETDYNGNAPEAISGVTATPAPEGGLSAELNFFMPGYDVKGEKLGEDEILEVTVTGLTTLTQVGTPGEEMSISVPTSQGTNGLSLTVSRTMEQKVYTSTPTYTEVYTGVGVPGIVGSLEGEVTEDNLGVTLRWTAPTTIEKGDWLDIDDLSYALYTNGASSWEKVKDLGKNIFEYTYYLSLRTRLQNKYYGIVCSNSAGMSESLRGLMFEVGKPLTLPLEEKFTDGVASLQPLTYATSSNYSRGKWMIADPGVFKDYLGNESGFALIGYPGGANSDGKVSLPKFSTVNMNEVSLRVSAWTGEDTAPIKLYAEIYGAEEPILIGEINPDAEGWTEKVFPLPEMLLNQKWVSVYMEVHYEKSAQFVAVESYDISGVSRVDETITGDLNISTAHGKILMSGTGKVTINTSSGINIGTFEIEGEKEVNVASGIYIIKTERDGYKIIVK